MTGFMDKVIGVYHFLTDRAPGNTQLVNPKPSPVNPWLKNGQPLLAKVSTGKDIKESANNAISLMGELGQVINRGDRVLVKPNFNSPDPYPASTDLEFLRVVVELLQEACAEVTIGESAGGIWRPTSKVFEKLGIYNLARDLGVELIVFEEQTRDWLRVKVDGHHLPLVTMPRSAYKADKLVYLPCMKTHNLARFSGALKLTVGFMHPGERRALHMGRLEQKIAEINLCWQPDLVIMDGRKAFVSGGPDKGQLEEPGLILISADPVAIDIEAVKILLSYGAKNKLPKDPIYLPQIATALRYGLGTGDGSYIVVE